MSSLQAPQQRARQLEVDPDVYEFLKAASEIGESPSSILRRLLQIPDSDIDNRRLAESSRIPVSASAAIEPDAIVVHLQNDDFRFMRNATDRYLSILGAAYKANPQAFSKILDVSGTSRQYFAKTAAEIEKSGTSTSPRQIPGTPYWALTNADTSTKIEMLSRALHRLGFRDETIKLACNSTKPR